MRYNKETQMHELSFYDHHSDAICAGVILTALILLITLPSYWAFYMMPSYTEGVVGLKAENNVFYSENCLSIYPSLTSSDHRQVCWLKGNYDFDSIQIGNLCKIKQVGMSIDSMSCSKP